MMHFVPLFNCGEYTWRFQDLSSLNGTYLNGHRTETGELKDGGSLFVGLPHVFNDNRSIRYISDTPKQNSFLQEQLNGLFLGTGENESPPQHVMFICASSDPQVNRSVTRYLAAAGNGAHASAVFLASGLSGLPQECHYIIDLTAEAVIYEKERASQRANFEPDSLSIEMFKKFSRNLAPLRIDSKQGSQSIPTMVSFLEGNNAKTPKALDLESKWAVPLPEQGMAVPIGLKGNGKPLFFDVHEKQSGLIGRCPVPTPEPELASVSAAATGAKYFS